MYILTRRRARVPLHTLTHTLFVAVPWKYYFCSSNIEILELWLFFFFFLKMDGSHVFLAHLFMLLCFIQSTFKTQISKGL